MCVTVKLFLTSLPLFFIILAPHFPLLSFSFLPFYPLPPVHALLLFPPILHSPNKVLMKIGMTLLHIPLNHLIHEHITINLNLLHQEIPRLFLLSRGAVLVHDSPLRVDGHGSRGGFAVDLGVDAVGHVG